jgi:hypothetical protein
MAQGEQTQEPGSHQGYHRTRFDLACEFKDVVELAPTFAFCGTGIVVDIAAAFTAPKVEQTLVIKNNGPIIVIKEGVKLFSSAVWGIVQKLAALECRFVRYCARRSLVSRVLRPQTYMQDRYRQQTQT